MSQILFNGAVVPTNSDDYALTEDMAKMCLSLNIPVPVNNQAERDGLEALAGGTLKVGTMVLRKDQSMFVEKWDGSNWKTVGHSEWTRTNHEVPQNQVWGVGALTLDTGKTTDNAFVTHPASNLLQLRDVGNYVLTFKMRSNATLDNRGFIQLDVAGASDPYRLPITGEDRGVLCVANFRSTAPNTQVVFTAYHESGASRFMDFRISATRIG